MAKKTISRKRIQKNITPKNCYFHLESKEPGLAEVDSLRKFLTDRGKIIPRSRSGICAKHQKHLTLSIKHARHLGLLPFVER